MSAVKSPLLIVVSAPSGAGKSTLCKRLLKDRKDIAYSVSCTTRLPRGAEKNGIAYFFLTKPDFEARIKNGDFLEYAMVHGNYYGTLKSNVVDAFVRGKSILMDIDVVGAEKIRGIVQTLPENDSWRKGFLDIFLLPPSLEELKRRLEARSEDTAESIATRMKNAIAEMEKAATYQHVIINDDLDRAYAELCAVIDRVK